MELKIKGQLPSLNEYINTERHNRFAAATLKQEMTELVAYEAKQQKLPRVESVSSITFIWSQHTKRRDPDNICGMGQKFIFDGLVAASVFPTDGWRLWGKRAPRITHLFVWDKKAKESVTVLIK